MSDELPQANDERIEFLIRMIERGTFGDLEREDAFKILRAYPQSIRDISDRDAQIYFLDERLAKQESEIATFHAQKKQILEDMCAIQLDNKALKENTEIWLKQIAERNVELDRLREDQITAWPDNDALTAENTRLKEWRPINTAPKDGTEVLLGKDIASVWIVRNGRWVNAEDWYPVEEDGSGWWAYRNSVGQEMLEGIYEPTHWMPMAKIPV